MARTDALVLGAGIVGVSTALHLARRGLAVTLVERGGVGEATSYGNSGVIGGAGVYPTAFPRRWDKVLAVALKRAPEANYHLSFLPRVAPWLFAYWRQSSPENLARTARTMRPLMARAVAEHETLMREAGALAHLRRDGWISLYRGDRSFASLGPELALGMDLGVEARLLDREGARALEPSLAPVFRHAIHWPQIATLANPLAVTRAYASEFVRRGGTIRKGDARTLARAASGWRVATEEGPVEADDAVVALGPWAPDVLAPLGIRLPLAVKRGYHRHFRPQRNTGLTRPVVDVENGYVLCPMEQGIRLTTGAEFAARDAAPTPVQFARLLPAARALFPLGEPVELEPWMGARPCFPDSMPVVGRAPGQSGLWLNIGHGHMGLTLGPVTGRLTADMMTGAQTLCDPAPYRAERFG